MPFFPHENNMVAGYRSGSGMYLFQDGQKKSRRPSASASLDSPCGDYCFFAGFLAGAFLGAAALRAASRPPMRVSESVALNGYWRTEVSVWPAVFRVISTRRLLAQMMVFMLRMTRARSSLVSS